MSTLTTSHQPPFWESSRRPLHPKCVWIESLGTSGTSSGGHRHFIFDYNLTNSDRSRSEMSSLSGQLTSSFSLEKMQSFDAMETKMSSLSIIGSGEGIQNERAFSSLDNRPEMMELLIDEQPIEPLDLSKNDKTVEPIEMCSEMSTTPSMKRITNEIDSNKHLLAERVLQWLDLAAERGHMAAARRSDHIGKLLNASKRRSVTAKEPRKLTETDDETAQKAKVKREPVRQLSMTFNDEQANDAQHYNRNVVSFSFGDLFPVTYKCSRKFLSFRRAKNVADRLEPLDLQSSIPFKVANGKKDQKKHPNGGKSKQKRFEYIEDQYRSLIQREILETTCNAQAAKRQLHIFMPNLPKRCLIANESEKNGQLIAPNSARDSDSCLSFRQTST